MLSVLDLYDLRGFVLETIPEPSQDDFDRHYIWSRINGKVRSFIINNCKDDVLSSLLTIQNAKEMWDKLSVSNDRQLVPHHTHEEGVVGGAASAARPSQVK